MGFKTKIADLGRLHEIIRAFSIAGFGDIFKRMGLEAATERTGKIQGWKYTDDIAHLERPQRIRKLFEVLGPTSGIGAWNQERCFSMDLLSWQKPHERGFV
jgi:hypothetical protein